MEVQKPTKFVIPYTEIAEKFGLPIYYSVDDIPTIRYEGDRTGIEWERE